MAVKKAQILDAQVLKSKIRKKKLAVRAKIKSKYRVNSGEFLKLYFPYLGLKTGEVCSGYWPIRDEIDSRPLLNAMMQNGFCCALPVIVDKKIEFREYKDPESLVEVGFGTLGPDQSAKVLSPDYLIVPLVAFDRYGGRIGYGGGYYDTAIAKLKAKKNIRCVGAAFSDQAVDEVPIESHDQDLDLVLTEQGIVRCCRE